LYLLRDGRDVLVSLYFHRMKRIADEKDRMPVLRHLTKAFYQRTFPSPFDPDDSRANLPRFIELEMKRPAKLNWAQHVRQWRPAFGNGIVPVSYEDLLADTQKAMEACLTELLSGPIDTEWLETCVDRFRFERVTGRRPGTEDRASFFRKGVAGDWRNHFTREAAEVFDRHTGNLLVELGYETDRSWVTRVGSSPDH